jgi:hypothetical protein
MVNEVLDAVRGGSLIGVFVMLKSVRVTVAALAFVGFGLAPVVANATIGPCIPWWCHPCPPKVVSGPDVSLGIFWAVGFFLCAGMGVGKLDAWAKNHHTQVTGQQQGAVFASCIFPLYGFNRNHNLPT